MRIVLLILLIFLIIVISGGLYWFGWRPEQIRKKCNIYAQEKAEKQMKNLFGTNAFNTASELGGEALLEETLNPIYNSCLRARGINK